MDSQDTGALIQIGTMIFVWVTVILITELEKRVDRDKSEKEYREYKKAHAESHDKFSELYTLMDNNF